MIYLFQLSKFSVGMVQEIYTALKLVLFFSNQQRQEAVYGFKVDRLQIIVL